VICIGINCTPKIAYVFVASDGVLEDREPRRLQLPAIETSRQLQTFVGDTRQALRDLNPDRVAVMRPEYGQQRPAVSAVYERAVLETLVRLAGVTAGAETTLLSRATVRAKFPSTAGCFEEHALKALGSTPLPLYWNKGRNLAALAALTVS
jgi:hypothetical protein